MMNLDYIRADRPSFLLPPSRPSSSSPILFAKLLTNPLRQVVCQSSSPASELSGRCWTSTASVRSQWAPLGLNGQRQRLASVGTAGPPLTSTATSRSQWALPDQKICQIKCQKICQKDCQKICQKNARKKERSYARQKVQERRKNVRKNVRRYGRKSVKIYE